MRGPPGTAEPSQRNETVGRRPGQPWSRASHGTFFDWDRISPVPRATALKIQSCKAGRAVLVSSPVMLEFARDVLRKESTALQTLVDRLPPDFSRICEAIQVCRGAVVVTGVGKAGLIGRKISATFASTGTRSFHLDPLNAFHGDLGMIGSDDMMLLLSNSGASTEMLLLADYGRTAGIATIAMTKSAGTPLARRCDFALDYGDHPEACPLRLAPSTSTTLMLALGDALALTVQNERGFTESDFARYHPAGALGRFLKKVEEVMRGGENVAMVSESQPVTEAVAAVAKARCGLCLVTDSAGKLVGVYSDGDFRRDATSGVDLQSPVGERCHRPGKRVAAGLMVGAALDIIRRARINSLPVVDDEGRPLGLLDLQDLI